MPSSSPKLFNGSPSIPTASYSHGLSLVALAEYLEEAKQETGILTIPDDVARELSKTITPHIAVQKKGAFPADKVGNIIHALGYEDHDLCGRLDAASLGLLVKIFLHTVPSNARERGICLIIVGSTLEFKVAFLWAWQELLQRNAFLAASAKPTTTSDASITGVSTKQHLGTEVLMLLIECFVEEREEPRFRRWVGLLVLELLRNGEDNLEQLDLAMPDDIRTHFGYIILNHESQILKNISASIIQEMMTAGSSIKDYFLTQISTATLDRFPTIPMQDSQWTECFENFLDELHEERILKEVASEIHIAIALAANDRTYSHGGAAITLTICEELNIVVPIIAGIPAQYIDIALENIRCVICAPVDLLSSSGNDVNYTATALSLQLYVSGTTNYLINGVPRLAEEFFVTFEDGERAELAAEHIREEQQKRISRQDELRGPKVSMVSNPISVREIPTQDNPVLGQDEPGPDTPGKIRAKAVEDAQETGSKHRVSLEGSRRNGRKVSSSISSTQTSFLNVAISTQSGPVNGITSGTNFENTIARMVVEEPLTCVNGGTNEALTSSDIWTKGQQLIEDAPEFQMQPASTARMDQPSLKVIGSHVTTILDSQPDCSDPEDLYSLSPAGQRAYQTRMQASKTNTEPDATIYENGQVPAANMYTGSGVVINRSRKSVDPIAAYQLLIHDVEKEEVEQSNLMLPPKSKLKDRLRDQHGLEPRAETFSATATSVLKGLEFEHDQSPNANSTRQTRTNHISKGATRAPVVSRKYRKRRSPQMSSDQVAQLAENDIYDIPKSQDPPSISQKPQRKVKQLKPKAQATKGRAVGKSTKQKSARSQVAAGKAEAVARQQKRTPPTQRDVTATTDSPEHYGNHVDGEADRESSGTLAKPMLGTKPERAKGPNTASRSHKPKTGLKELKSITVPWQLPRPTRSAAVQAKKKIANLDHVCLSKEEEVEHSTDRVAVTGREASIKSTNPKESVEHEGASNDARNASTNRMQRSKDDESRINQEDFNNKVSLAVGSQGPYEELMSVEDDGFGMVEEPSVEETPAPEIVAQTSTESRILSEVSIAGKIINEGPNAPILHEARKAGELRDTAESARSKAKPAAGERVQDSATGDHALLVYDTIDPTMLQVPGISQQTETSGVPASDQPNYVPTHEAKFKPLATATERVEELFTAPNALFESPRKSREAHMMNEVCKVPEMRGSLHLDIGSAVDRDRSSDIDNKRSTADSLNGTRIRVGNTIVNSAKREKISPTSSQEHSSQARKQLEKKPSEVTAPLSDILKSSSNTVASRQPVTPRALVPSQQDQAMPAVVRKPQSLNPALSEHQLGNQVTQKDPAMVKTNARTLMQPANPRRLSRSRVRRNAHQANETIERVPRSAQKALQTQDSEVITIPSDASKEDEASSSPSSWSISRPTHANGATTKRKATEEASRAPSKKSKISRLNANSDVTAQTQLTSKINSHTGFNESLTLVDDNAIRKTPIISFGKNGPRNQGVPSVNKPSPRKRNAQSKFPTSHLTIEKPTQVQPKRKHEDNVQAPLHTTPTVKRQKSVIVVPRIIENVRLDVTESRSPSLADFSPRQSSQGTRVDEYGSPVPIVSFVQKPIALASHVPDALGISRSDDPDDSTDGNRNKTGERTHDDLSEEGVFLHDNDQPTANPGDTPDRGNPEILLGQNSPRGELKAVPAVTAHRVAPGGKFINVQTNDVVEIETSLQDPFVLRGSQGSGTFMDKLQAQIPRSKMQLEGRSTANNNNGSEVAFDRTTQEDDPEKTLLGIGDYRDLSYASAEHSTTSLSCSSQTTKYSATSGGVSEAAPDSQKEWRALLQPHQRRTVDVLRSITARLVRHLVDQETAITDIAQDYLQNGITLIDALEKHQTGDIARIQEGIDRTKAELARDLEQATEGIAQGNQEARQYSTATLLKKHKGQRQMFDQMMTDALRSVVE
ncbi:MAG: hypothetical protein M1835_004273 [Candelina submexicana]|nr:MAG: hypothetical protein M1835_004273 [Candelina submexicana]